MSKEEAERLARRDRNRLIGLGIVTVMVGGMYLYSANNARSREAEERAAANRAAEAPIVDDVQLVPFKDESVLAKIKDATQVEQEFIDPEPLDRVFEYARIQTPGSFEARGIVEADASSLQPILEAPSEHRLDALRIRGTVLGAAERPRSSGLSSDWMGSILTLDGQVVHFLVAGAPLQSDGKRGVETGDFLRVDGLFLALYRTPLDVGNGLESITAPLVLGPRAEPSTPPMTEEIARLMPSMQEVQDDTIGAVFDDDVFRVAQWELMGHAKLIGPTTDWSTVPELDQDTLQSMYEDGDAFRGKPFVFPVSINLDTFSKRAPDNPLRLERFTEGWVGNNRWKDPVPTVRWIGPFERRDLMREDYDDKHRYVTAKGYFFRNHVFKRQNGQPGKAPIFVLYSLDVFVPEPDASLTYLAYGVFGLTIALIVAIFALLRSDRRKSAQLYEDMVRRKRARRERAASASAGTA